MDCVLCNSELNEENESREHFLPQAIGGRDSSKQVICASCNAFNEEYLDTPTTEKFQFIATWIKTRRERGKHPSVRIPSSAFINFVLLPGGEIRLESKQQEGPDGSTMLFFEDEEDLEKERKKIEEKNQKRKKKMEILAEGEIPFNDLQLPPYSLGDDTTLRTLTKAALLFYAANVEEPKHDRRVIEFIRGALENKFAGPYFSASIPFPGAQPDCIYHLLLINGDPKTRSLYAYIELFGTFRYKILLNNEYDGESVNLRSIYNVKTWENLPWNQEFGLAKDDFQYFTDDSTIEKMYPLIQLSFMNLHIILSDFTNQKLNERARYGDSG